MFVHVPTIQRHCRQSFHVHLQIPQGTGQMNSSERQSTKEPSEAVRPQSILPKCQGRVFSLAPLGWALLRNAHQARFPPVEARKSKYVCLTSPKGKGCLSIGVGRLALHHGQPRSIKNFQLQSTTCYYLLLPWLLAKVPVIPARLRDFHDSLLFLLILLNWFTLRQNLRNRIQNNPKWV